jgi:hypothetical protein
MLPALLFLNKSWDARSLAGFPTPSKTIGFFNTNSLTWGAGGVNIIDSYFSWSF